MLDSLPFADYSSTRHRAFRNSLPGRFAVDVFFVGSDGVEAGVGDRADAAIGQFLDSEGEAVLQIAPVEGGRLGLEQLPPALLQRRYRQGGKGGSPARCRLRFFPPA